MRSRSLFAPGKWFGFELRRREILAALRRGTAGWRPPSRTARRVSSRPFPGPPASRRAAAGRTVAASGRGRSRGTSGTASWRSPACGDCARYVAELGDAARLLAGRQRHHVIDGPAGQVLGPAPADGVEALHRQADRVESLVAAGALDVLDVRPSSTGGSSCPLCRSPSPAARPRPAAAAGCVRRATCGRPRSRASPGWSAAAASSSSETRPCRARRPRPRACKPGDGLPLVGGRRGTARRNAGRARLFTSVTSPSSSSVIGRSSRISLAASRVGSSNMACFRASSKAGNAARLTASCVRKSR